MDASDWDERYAGSELVWSATPNQFVAQAFADHEPGRAVDLAAGEGRNALWLASLGWDVTAVDFSQTGLDKGRAVEPSIATKHPVTWVCADVLTWDGLDKPDQPWDLALVAYLQLPAKERAVAVRRAFGAVRPGGELFWVAHDSSNLLQGTGGPQDPEVLMTAEDLLDDLEGESFDVLSAGWVERVVSAEDEHGGEASRTAYDCLLRVKRT